MALREVGLRLAGTMKIGFSSLACPAWDLKTIVEQAASLGYDGVELRGLRGELHLPIAPELAGQPDDVRKLFSDHKIELVCLGASAVLTSSKSRELADQKGRIIEFIELASRLGCPAVRIFVGDIERGDEPRACLSRMVETLASLVPVASRHNITILLENGGDFSGSQPLWFLADAVGHPLIRCCWNQCNAMTVGEKPTISIPRLGAKIGLVHVCDASFDDHGILMERRPLGEGDTQIARQIELLKGIIYRQYVIFEWPKLWVDSLSGPQDALPQAVQFLRTKIEEKQDPLTAYKGDKHAPNLAPVPGTTPSA